jgi:hypothetical protein
MAPTDPRRKANVKLAWILASVALVFCVGFVVKIIWMGRGHEVCGSAG